MTRTIQRYGWIPDLPDQRDFLYAAPPAVLKALPTQVDLTRNCPAVYDQGQVGSCTANAIGAAHQFEQMKQNRKTAFIPSRLFIYYNERAIEGTIRQDSGAMLRDGIKSVVKQGVCPESAWPYITTRITMKPSNACYTEALNHQVVSYQRVTQTVSQMKGCLAAGYPFVFGFSVYASFESATVAKTGKVPMPGHGEKMVGGHAVTAVGYNDAEQRFIVRNSWSARWGKKGYCAMPYAYLTDPQLASDFWTIRLVEVSS